MGSAPLAANGARVLIRVRGAVQGVGFRPFVHRLANELRLGGFVLNTPEGVTIEAEGAPAGLDELRRQLLAGAPGLATVTDVEVEPIVAQGESAFSIRTSRASGAVSALILPDIASCSLCLVEMHDAADRRHRYPFTNCTACGPRYSILLALPYDRLRTTMADFRMCDRCRSEYEDPADRRFHAEPTACPDCGPRLRQWDLAGRILNEGDAALAAAADAVKRGAILALKGLGGFHLIADARRDDVVRELRRRKHRDTKPLALMVRSCADARRLAELSPEEEALLLAPQAPIVLLRKRRQPSPSEPVAEAIAPDNPHLGLMLPYTPLHHLLLDALGFPIVATSGNLSEEPICTDEREALLRLGGIADVFLVHDRRIARPVDDSVVQLVGGRPMLLRRARGYAPLPIGRVATRLPLLAVGPHLKSSVALVSNGQAILSPHIGNLDSQRSFEAFESTIETLSRLHRFRPGAVACDDHPDYLSTSWAHGSGLPVLGVQHHYAHVLAGMLDNALEAPVLGLAWDGSGYGADGTIWGGEALRITPAGYERVGWMRPFPLPGGERAVREPRRSALGALYALRGDDLFASGGEPLLAAFSSAELGVLRGMLRTGVNCPTTSSVGRLFDAAAALLGLRRGVCEEGEAAMALESALDGSLETETCAFEITRQGAGFVVDWGPMLEELGREAHRGSASSRLSKRFHDTLVEMIVALAQRAGEPRVVLTGGCFQNRYLCERAILRLRETGFQPFWHHQIPPNDGGIAAGQLLGAARRLGVR